MKIIKPSVEFYGAVPTDYKSALEFIEKAGRTCYKSENKGDPEKFVKKLIASGHLAMVEHSNFVVRREVVTTNEIAIILIQSGKYLNVAGSDNSVIYVGGSLTAWFNRLNEILNTPGDAYKIDMFRPFVAAYGVIFNKGIFSDDFGWEVCPHNEIPKELNRYSAKFICDRGITHELVRHRPCSFAQESTRYVASSHKRTLNVRNEEDVVIAYDAGMSMRIISERSNNLYNEWDVYKLLVKNNIKRRPLGNTGPVDHNFFEIIDSSEKAYLLGMIQADGSVRSGIKSPQLSITQHENFAWYLHRMITDLIRPSASVNKDKHCKQITVTSSKLISDLIDKGVTPNKSFEQTESDINKLWESIPDKLIPSFLRGFLDGDGSIRFFNQSNKGSTASCNINWSGHKDLLYKISLWLYENFRYRAKVIQDSISIRLYRLSITTPKIGINVIDLLMKDFVWPYGHPKKTARMMAALGKTNYPQANIGDDKFVIIEPEWFANSSADSLWTFYEAMDTSERSYTNMLNQGLSPQQARAVLPNALKTEIVVTADAAEWSHIRKLRTAKDAHPDMQRVMNMMPWNEFL